MLYKAIKEKDKRQREGGRGRVGEEGEKQNNRDKKKKKKGPSAPGTDEGFVKVFFFLSTYTYEIRVCQNKKKWMQPFTTIARMKKNQINAWNTPLGSILSGQQ